ncbi:MAG: hypothetical protein OHK006_10050 [Thermodesulfovibrionales bacterium]
MRTRECTGVRDLLPRYCEDGLDAPEISAVEAHLASCSECAEFRNRLVSSWNLLDSWDVPDPPLGFSGRILARLHEERRNVWLRKALPAAALLLIMLGLVWLSVSSDRERSDNLAGRTLTSPQQVVGQPPASEEEIIATLELLEEKEFYDNIEELKKIDYLPLVDEKENGRDNRDNRSQALEVYSS